MVDQLRAVLDTATFKVQAADARARLLKQQESEAEQRYKLAEIAKRQSEELAAQAGVARSDLAGLRARATAASLEEARNPSRRKADFGMPAASICTWTPRA